MAASAQLSFARKELSDVLGDDMRIYLQILQSWFKLKVTREDFDHQARKLLSKDTVHLHNQFLLALLSKCHLLLPAIGSAEISSSHSSHSSARKKEKLKNKRKLPNSIKANNQTFVPVNPMLQAPQVGLMISEQDEKNVSFCSRDMVLPDMAMIHGRLLVTAWDLGLEEVEEDAVKLLIAAVEIQLKNILTAVLSKKQGFKLREKRFKYSIGQPMPQTHIRNSLKLVKDREEAEAVSFSKKGVHMPTIKSSVETGQRDASTYLACAGEAAPFRHMVTLDDVFHTLQAHRSVIPSHAVYASNMERIINKVHHPSNEELEQDLIHLHEANLRHELHSAQKASRWKQEFTTT